MPYNWKKERNYRKFQEPDGSVRHVIFIDGLEIEVAAEVYSEYARMDRRERYRQEANAWRLLSLPDEDAIPEGFCGTAESAEDAAIGIADRLDWQGLLQKLPQALSQLDEQEKFIVRSLYLDGRSEREIARTLGISQPAVHKRQERILRKLKFFFSNS